MKRVFPYITVGRILEELWEEMKTVLPEEDLWRINKHGQRVKRYPINRVAFYRAEKRLDLPEGERAVTQDEDHRWRRYTRDEAEAVKEIIRKKYLRLN